MSLADVQRGLAWTLLRAASPQAAQADLEQKLAELSLAPEERAWLAGLPSSPGFQMTCYIQRWWRETKLTSTLRLTLAALEDGREPVVSAYLDRRPCSSLFFLPEALAFLEFVAGLPASELPRSPHLLPVVAFERAFLLCQDEMIRFPPPAAPPPETPLARHPASALVQFAAPFAPLFSALLDRTPLPPPQAPGSAVLVAPGLPHLWRPASDQERALLLGWDRPRTLADHPPEHHPAIRELLNAGALQPAPLLHPPPPS